MIQLLQISKEELMKDLECLFYRVLEQNNTQSDPERDSDFYTREQTAKLLRVSTTTLYHWNKNGILKHSKIGSRVYYARTEVQSKLKAAS